MYNMDDWLDARLNTHLFCVILKIGLKNQIRLSALKDKRNKHQ